MGWFKTPEEKQAGQQRRLEKGLFKDNIEKVRAALDAGASPNACGQYGTSALAYHASEKRRDVVQLLLSRGADPNGSTRNDYTPLILAAANGDMATVRMLCEHGANVNAQNKDGHSSLHRAAYWGRGDVIEYLLTQGADAMLRDARMELAADIAAKEKYPGIAALLRGELDAGRAVAEETHDGWHKTAVHEIALVTDKPAIGYRITEIFNFKAGHYTHIAANLKTGMESQSQRGFDDFGETEALREAMSALLVRGGRVEPDMVARLSGKGGAAIRGLSSPQGGRA